MRQVCTDDIAFFTKAHQFDATHDWVVLYYDGRSDEHQSTVITAHRGHLSGKRIVRGRESECEEYYGHAAAE